MHTYVMHYINFPSIIWYYSGKTNGENGQYSDLHGHWAEKIIRDMISEGYIKGELVNGELVINPDRPITRAEFVVVLTKAKTTKTSDSAKSFSDLKENSWYSEAVEIATSNGIINGYPDGTFKPNNPITRAEASAIISNSNNLNQEDNLKKLDNVKEFNDISKNHWYYNSVMLCRLFDIISGYPDGSFRPGNNITRAEAFVMIYKSIKQKMLRTANWMMCRMTRMTLQILPVLMIHSLQHPDQKGQVQNPEVMHHKMRR